MSDITGSILHEDDVESETNFVRDDNLTQDVADDDDDESEDTPRCSHWGLSKTESKVGLNDEINNAGNDEYSVASTVVETVPGSAIAYRILSKLVIKQHQNYYLLPGTKSRDIKTSEVNRDYFISGKLLREYLCRTGIKVPRNSPISHDEKETLTRWLSFTFVPLENPTVVPSVPPIGDREAWSLLVKLNYRYSGVRYTLPNVNLRASRGGAGIFESLPELQQYICRNGVIPHEDVSKEEVLRLALWASDSNVNFFLASETGRGRRKRLEEL
jgi:hypothetical protein